MRQQVPLCHASTHAASTHALASSIPLLLVNPLPILISPRCCRHALLLRHSHRGNAVGQASRDNGDSHHRRPSSCVLPFPLALDTLARCRADVRHRRVPGNRRMQQVLRSVFLGKGICPSRLPPFPRLHFSHTPPRFPLWYLRASEHVQAREAREARSKEQAEARVAGAANW